FPRFEEFPTHITQGERKRRAQKQLTKLRKKGKQIEPVAIEGRHIAETFWGKSWCDNLEAYSDYETRLPRGRSYVRSGAVLDLKLEPGRIDALVQGTELY